MQIYKNFLEVIASCVRTLFEIKHKEFTGKVIKREDMPNNTLKFYPRNSLDLKDPYS